MCVFLAPALSACAEARVHYTFEEDGSFRVEGSVTLTEGGVQAKERLLRVREQLDRVGLTTADLTEPGSVGFTFRGDSTHDLWAKQQAGGGPRLWTDQGLLRKKFVFFWPLDWKTYLEGVAPEGLDEFEAASFQAADLQVTASFPGSGARQNGTLDAGSGGRTVTWTVLPLEPRSMRAEYSFLIWWRAALAPVLVVGTLIALLALRYRSLRDVPRGGDALPALRPPPTAGLPPLGPRPSPPSRGPPPGPPQPNPTAAPAPAAALRPEAEGVPPASRGEASSLCPVCDAPVVPGEPCLRCVATAESAGGMISS